MKEMENRLINPDSPDNTAIRRQMFRLAALAALLFVGLLAAMISSFVGILPNWVGWASSIAVALASWFIPMRAESLRRRLKES